MRYYQQIVLFAFLMQVVVLCWARTRFIHDSWPISSFYWNDIEEMNNDESNNNHDSNNNNHDNELFERATPSLMKSKKLFRTGFRLGSEDRPKKLGDTTKYQGGRSLQGLWAMPGRR